MYTLILDEYGYYTTAFSKSRVKTLYQVHDIQGRWDARKQRRSLQQEIKKCGFDRKKHKI